MTNILPATLKQIQKIAHKAECPFEVTEANAQEVIKSLAENRPEFVADEIENIYNVAIRNWERGHEENYELISNGADGIFALLDIQTDYPGLYPSFTIVRGDKTFVDATVFGAIRHYNNFWGFWTQEKKLNGYICFYNRKKIEIEAESSYKAQQLAATQLRVTEKNRHKISVVVAEIKGKPVIHSTLL